MFVAVSVGRGELEVHWLGRGSKANVYTEPPMAIDMNTGYSCWLMTTRKASVAKDRVKDGEGVAEVKRCEWVGVVGVLEGIIVGSTVTAGRGAIASGS